MAGEPATMLAPLKKSAIVLICFEKADLQLVEVFIWISLCGPFRMVRFCLVRNCELD